MYYTGQLLDSFEFVDSDSMASTEIMCKIPFLLLLLPWLVPSSVVAGIADDLIYPCCPVCRVKFLNFLIPMVVLSKRLQKIHNRKHATGFDKDIGKSLAIRVALLAAVN